jgi:predicted nucleic acid-binding protein
MDAGTAQRGSDLMAWVVDTCLILDVLDADPEHGVASAEMLDRYASRGLVVCPVTYIELAPAFDGDRKREEFFLRSINVEFALDWTWRDTENAHSAWLRCVRQKRSGDVRKRPIADIQIGAFSERFQGLLTRNSEDFRSVFPILILGH